MLPVGGDDLGAFFIIPVFYMCWCVQLFSKQSAAAARAGREGVPRPIKFHLKLGGFGSAVQLDGQGCAMDYPPYRSHPHITTASLTFWYMFVQVLNANAMMGIDAMSGQSLLLTTADSCVSIAQLRQMWMLDLNTLVRL